MLVRDLWIEHKVNASLGESDIGKMKFISALNAVRGDINAKFSESFAALTTADIAANTDLDWGDYFDNALKAGMKHYLQRDGALAGEPDPQSWQTYQKHLRRAMAPAVNALSSFKTRTQAAEAE